MDIKQLLNYNTLFIIIAYIISFFIFCAIFMFCYNSTIPFHDSFPYLAKNVNEEKHKKMTYFESMTMVIFLWMLGVLLFKSFMLR